MNDKLWVKETWAADVPAALSEKLDGFEVDDEKTPTLTMAVDEARYIIGLHNESGTISSAMLSGEYGEEDRRTALATVRACKRFIKKYDVAAKPPVKVPRPAKPLIEVKIGQVWRDKDKRMNNRCERVKAIEKGKAVMGSLVRDTGPTTKVAVARLRKGEGWELVTDV